MHVQNFLCPPSNIVNELMTLDVKCHLSVIYVTESDPNFFPQIIEQMDVEYLTTDSSEHGWLLRVLEHQHLSIKDIDISSLIKILFIIFDSSNQKAENVCQVIEEHLKYLFLSATSIKSNQDTSLSSDPMVMLFKLLNTRSTQHKSKAQRIIKSIFDFSSQSDIEFYEKLSENEIIVNNSDLIAQIFCDLIYYETDNSILNFFIKHFVKKFNTDSNQNNLTNVIFYG